MTTELESTKISMPAPKVTKYDFFNIKLDITGQEEVFRQCKHFLNSNRPNTIFFLNAHCFNQSQINKEYRNAINQSDLLLNDGIGIKLASLLAGVNIGENLNGTDLIPKILALAGRENKKVFFLGGIEGVAEKAASRTRKLIPGIRISGCRSGYFKDEDTEGIIKHIDNSGADILVLGMGVPKQELWAYENQKKLKNIKIIIAGGAILDFISGRAKRAPLWMRKIHMEWLYRLYREPGRMWKRYIIGNIIFFVHLFRIKYLLPKNNQAS